MGALDPATTFQSKGGGVLSRTFPLLRELRQLGNTFYLTKGATAETAALCLLSAAGCMGDAELIL